MLSGIKFVDKDVAARSLEADRKASNKEKKRLKKVAYPHVNFLMLAACDD